MNSSAVTSGVAPVKGSSGSSRSLAKHGCITWLWLEPSCAWCLRCVYVLSRDNSLGPPWKEEWDSPVSNTGVDCHFLLQGVFPIHGSKLSLESPELAGGFHITSSPLGVWGNWSYQPGASQVAQWLKKKKKSACQCRRKRRCKFNPWVRKTPWRQKWQSIPIFLPGESLGQRSLLGYNHRVAKSRT